MIKISRKTTVLMHKFYDIFTPKFLKNNRYFNKFIVTRFMGDSFDLDWKIKYESKSYKEWSDYYDIVLENYFREEDITRKQKDEVIKYLFENSILEVGAGFGLFSIELSKKGYDVFCLDCSKVALRKCKKNANIEKVNLHLTLGFTESLPYKSHTFDTVICCHTLEHVRDLEKSIKELKRVAKKRIITIVPKQKYSRYTFDLHTQFFNNLDDLEKGMEIKKHETYYVDGDIFFSGDLVD